VAPQILIVCEGISDVEFLTQLIKANNLQADIAVKTVGNRERGISCIGKQLNAVQTAPDMKDNKLVVVVADNDSDPDANFQMVKDQILQTGTFGVPEKPRSLARPAVLHPSDGRTTADIIVVMLPWDDKKGNLETLLFAAGAKNNIALSKCVDAFASCAGRDEWSVGKLSKLKARTLFSATAVDNSSVPVHFAWCPDAGDPFPINSSSFKQIAKCLKDIVKQFKRSHTVTARKPKAGP
jgi:hypothetical protein